ncbi:MAG: hypothetical protein CEN89_341 [Candidatus Berkelbacteria bacterium Licking1014_7]|uniref:DUF1648 domain-containing protein n=1 Tax=Candidatus Berkelbacteria bacterium Licking1014_7 TaxID=2017147 RepID=A0A554LJB6_9BACT|nr:MAG: hypothetical protein CEN89_341 [Candidatus Berkelbacteria bacterium Licking1014_7]
MKLMKKLFWGKWDWLILALIGCVFILSGMLWQELPDQLPVHWNFAGEPDRYGSKFINLFALPIFSLLTLLGMSWIPRIDPFSKNYEKFAGAFMTFKAIITLFFIYLYAVVIYASFYGDNIPGNIFFIPAFSVLFIIMGYYLPRLRRNYFIGIRTPWTLSSDESWDKSHFWAGRVFVAVGLINLLGIFIDSFYSIWLFFSILSLGIIGIVIYSYFVYKKDKNNV